MQLPTIQGVIDRRILINYRVDPTLLSHLVPAPLQLKMVGGMGIAGICFTRLKQVRPRYVPAPLGLFSDNAAHRIAVEWEDHGIYREGVYIPWQATSSRFNAFAGGRLLPGMLQYAHFQSQEDTQTFHIAVASADGKTQVAIQAHTGSEFPKSSCFDSLEEASAFFERSSTGYSVTAQPGRLDGLTLQCVDWKVEPLQATTILSSFFDDQQRFPTGSASLDCVLLMRGIKHEWRAQASLFI